MSVVMLYPYFGHIPMFAFSSLMLKRSVKLLNNIKFAIITFSSSLLFFSLFFSSSSFYFFRRGSYTHTHTHTHTHTVNKLVFYAQSTGTVISGRRERERGERERERESFKEKQVGFKMSQIVGNNCLHQGFISYNSYISSHTRGREPGPFFSGYGFKHSLRLWPRLSHRGALPVLSEMNLTA